MQKTLDSRSVNHSQVGFTQKTIHGKRYWYTQYTDVSGARKQRYVGPDNVQTQETIHQRLQQQNQQQSILAESDLVAMAIAGGAPAERGRAAKLLSRLSNSGIFEHGGVLIGSYAYACYSAMLGMLFDEQNRKTEDMDVAYNRAIKIGIQCNIPQEVASIAPAMAPVRQINPWVPPYEISAPDGVKLEFLTTKQSPTDKQPIHLPPLGDQRTTARLHGLPYCEPRACYRSLQRGNSGSST